MTISLIKASPNLYAGKKIKKLINQKHSRLRRKPYTNQLLIVKNTKSVNKHHNSTIPKSTELGI